MVYNFDAIIHIGEAGLEYIDEYDDVRFINFEACGQNASTQRQNPAAVACVARRMVKVNRSGVIRRTIEFYTRPPIVFVLDSDQQFQGVRLRIEQMGWHVV